MLQNLPFCTFGFLVCVLVALPPSSAHGQCEMGTLIPADPDHYATIHQAGAIDGDTIVANDRNRMGFYIFERTGTTWVETAHTAGPDVALTPLAISGDLIVAGDAVDDEGGDDAGAAYVYRRSGDEWVQAAKLIAGDAAPEDHFGVAVAIDGDYVVVGQVRWGYGEPPGSAYVFRRDDQGTPNIPEDDVWVEQTRLTASDGPAGNNLFGRSLSIDGEAIIVGAYLDYSGTNTGAAYVYRRNGDTWTEEVKLTPSDGAYSDFFGFSVAICGNEVMVGAPYHSDAGLYSGSVYVYQATDGAWVETGHFQANDTNANDEFGSAVALDGDRAVIGAPDRSGAYLFSREGGGWVEVGELIPANPGGSNGSFGTAVALSGDYAVVADAYVFGGIPDESSSYVFAVAGDCNENTTPDICDILWGTSGDADGDGLPDECEVLSIVSSVPPDAAIDARQPTEPDDSGMYGWSAAFLTFDGDTEGLTPESFTITLDPPGTPPFLWIVFTDENTAWLQFGDFAPDIFPVGHWTIITHNDSNTSVRIGYLPADVNNDKLSNANDVLFLIDVLNGIIDPEPPEYQTDTDRSGVTNPSDVLRVIDLLNGAGEYDVHLGATLPE